jgi:hypothetical protein
VGAQERHCGASGRVFEQFVEEIVKPSGGDLYLSVRKENAVACSFYERHGMKVVGTADWRQARSPVWYTDGPLTEVVLVSAEGVERALDGHHVRLRTNAKQIGKRRSRSMKDSMKLC